MKRAKGLHKAGGIKQATMWEIDSLCLPKIQDYLQKCKLSEYELVIIEAQAVFAAFLNISPSTIQKWQSGRHCRGAFVEAFELSRSERYRKAHLI